MIDEIELVNTLNNNLQLVIIQPFSIGMEPFSRKVLFPETYSDIIQDLKIHV